MSCEPIIVDGYQGRRLVLPLPPSVNGYWTRGKMANGKRNMRRTDRAQSFMNRALIAINKQGSPSFGSVPVVVVVYLHCRAGKKAGDLDNYNKGIFDALTHGRVWDDDDQVIDLRVVRRESVDYGACVVDIRAATNHERANAAERMTLAERIEEWGLI